MEIDPDVGQIELASYCVVDDVGVVVNPMLLEGQVHGSVAQGVGQILMEQVVFDVESAQLLTASLMDYALPRADNLCNLRVDSLCVPTKLNPLGAKGAGEAGTIGSLAAVVNAIIDALSPLGVRELDMSVTSERVWRAIRRKTESLRGSTQGA